jgi:hypothetical protein
VCLWCGKATICEYVQTEQCFWSQPPTTEIKQAIFFAVMSGDHYRFGEHSNKLFSSVTIRRYSTGRIMRFINPQLRGVEGLVECTLGKLKRSFVWWQWKKNYRSKALSCSYNERQARTFTGNYSTIIPTCKFCALHCKLIKFNYEKDITTVSTSSRFCRVHLIPAFVARSP